METTKTTIGTRTNLTTFMADLRSHEWINFHNFNSQSFSFVLNETLQLIETPIANPIIHNFSPSDFSDSFQVFHNNFVSIKIGNNVLADVMVYPSHEPFLSTRDFLQQSLSGICAFGLKFASQEFEFPFCLLDNAGIEKPAVRCNGKVIYSEVNAKNFVLSRVSDINFFGKCKDKITSAFSINHQKAFSNIPSKILLETIWNRKRNLNTTFDCSQRQNIVFEGSRTRKIISHTAMIDNRFTFHSFDNSTSLFDTSDCKLRLQTFCFDIGIDKRMKLDVVLDSSLPSLIDTELQTLFVKEQSPINNRISFQLNFNTCSAQHRNTEQKQLFKDYAGLSCGDINGGWQFLPTMNCRVSLPNIL